MYHFVWGWFIRSVMSDPWDPMDCSSELGPWDFPGKNTGVGCHFFPQGIFPTQELNPGLLHCTWNPYPLNHQGSTVRAGKEQNFRYSFY